MIIPIERNNRIGRTTVNWRQYKLVVSLYVVHVASILMLCVILTLITITLYTRTPALITDARNGINSIREDVKAMSGYLEDLDRKFPNITNGF